MPFKTYFLVGGAGFIGSHFADALLQNKDIQRVTIFDNFSSGREWHYQHLLKDKRLLIIKEDVQNMENLTQAMQGHDVVMHFASNPDISLATKDPTVDFTQGVYLTFNVVEAARLTNVRRILYMSGSGVYGDAGLNEIQENYGPLKPISTYGASKLFGEAFIASYTHMFNLSACVFRFGNVVGARQTHGVGYDFVKQLIRNPDTLTILGDGKQSKSYIYINDVIRAVLLAHEKLVTPYEVYNVATGDYITVKEIADITFDCLDIPKPQVNFTGGDRGWKGDVPIVRLNTDKIKTLGWQCHKNSASAIKESVTNIIQQIKQGLIS
jgi:UDP-glucose 4-epimerase